MEKRVFSFILFSMRILKKELIFPCHLAAQVSECLTVTFLHVLYCARVDPSEKDIVPKTGRLRSFSVLFNDVLPDFPHSPPPHSVRVCENFSQIWFHMEWRQVFLKSHERVSNGKKSFLLSSFTGGHPKKLISPCHVEAQVSECLMLCFLHFFRDRVDLSKNRHCAYDGALANFFRIVP